MADLYEYTPFTDTNSIRILYIEPALENEGIGRCQLRLVNLDDLPEFEALSYTWGRPILSHHIFIGGKRLPITYNLAEALSGIQKQSEVRLLWADALCINQNDIQERNQQVQLMSEIYHRATQVLIWLGPESDDVLPALHLLKKMAEIAMQEASSGNNRLTDARLPSFSTPEQWGLPPFEKPEWHCLIRFFLRPWFMCVWVVQEVRAASAALVICGKIEASWILIYIASSWFVSNNYMLSLGSNPAGGSPGVIHLPNRIGCHRLGGDVQFFKPSLSRVLRQMRALTATDPRDKVFALVNLSIEAESHDSRLLPDYSKSLAHAYRDISRYLIEAGSLDILSAVSWVSDNRSPLIWEDLNIPIEGGVLTRRQTVWGPPDESIIFPSWVPRWDSANIPLPLTDSLEDRETFLASGDLPLEIIKSSDEDDLILRGLAFDLTTDQADIKRSYEVGEDPIQHDEYVTWKAIALQAYYYPFASRIKVLHSTLTAGLTLNQTPIGSDAQHQANMIAFENKMARGISDSKEVTLTFEGGNADDYTQVVLQITHERRIFMTAKGYMGLGPRGMLPGDTICILFGGLTPYVLRKKDKRWQFIGECYVHGIMHGEVVEGVKNNSSEGEIFKIR